MTYINIMIDSELVKLLSASGAVLISGVKACGKIESANLTSHLILTSSANTLNDINCFIGSKNQA